MNEESRSSIPGRAIILAVATFVLQLCFFAPLHSLINNFGEFSTGFPGVVAVYTLVSLVLFLLLLGLARLVGWRLAIPALTFFSVAGFLESRFLFRLAGHAPFDGSLIDWQALQRIAWLEIAVLAGLAALFVVIRRRVQLMSAVSLFILLFLTTGLIHQVYEQHSVLFSDQAVDREHEAYFDGFYRLAPRQNVIHIVPDQAQGAMLHDILASQYDRYGPVFDGFTLFTQATGQYKSTYPSVAFYMSGEGPEPDYDLVREQAYSWDYVESVLREKSIVSTLARQGFRTYGFQFHPGIFCKGEYTACTGTHDEVFGGENVRSPARRLASAAATGLDMGLFQLSPVLLRERVFADGRWRFRRLTSGEPTHSGILDLFMTQLEVGEGAGSYNYFHHAGAHAPLLFDRDCNYTGPSEVSQENQRGQVMCTLAQLEQLMEALKDEGVYDQTMIVINGDHGSPWLPEGFDARAGETIPGSLMGGASTLLLIKPPGARGSLQFSSSPASIGDIPATIMAAFGFDAVHNGAALFDSELRADRERHYYSYTSSARTHLLQALPILKHYRIRGDVFDERSWLPPNALSVTESASGHVSRLYVDQPDFMDYAHGFSWLTKQKLPMRWVEGTRAGVALLRPEADPLALVLEIHVPAQLSGQWLEVTIQGRSVARLDDTDLAENRHIIWLDEEIPDDEVLNIEFELGKSFKPENDHRDLSILFRYVGLVPAG